MDGKTVRPPDTGICESHTHWSLAQLLLDRGVI